MKSRTTKSLYSRLNVSPRAIIAFLAISLAGPSSVNAQVYNLGVGGSWNSGGNWNPASIPNATGAAVAFFNAAGASNVAQTANRSITLDGGKTVGSISFNNDAGNTFTTSIATGTGGPLTFDEAGAGPATITVPAGVGTGNFTISVGMSLTDSLTATVNNITASSTAGALNLTATISGAGGFTKQGDGLATFGTGAKTYTGPTVISGGRMRMSLIAAATATSSFTINGGQLDLITTGGYLFGSGPLNLNGTGPLTGPFAVFPGAIRNDTGLSTTISNAVVLQSDTLLHVEGSAAGVITLLGPVSGPGKLFFAAPNSSANQGQLILAGTNSYQGGTLIRGGTLVVSNAACNLGTGDVTVDNSTSPTSTAKLMILAGVTNAIADTATLSLAGGTAGTVDLGAGVNEVVGVLKLAGVTQASGTYGSTSSAALNQNNTYFSGTGIVTVAGSVPPPSLTIVSVVPNVVISWPTNSAGFTLEQKTTVDNATIWATNTDPVVVSGTNYTVTTGISNAATFFRLIK